MPKRNKLGIVVLTILALLVIPFSEYITVRFVIHEVSTIFSFSATPVHSGAGRQYDLELIISGTYDSLSFEPVSFTNLSSSAEFAGEYTVKYKLGWTTFSIPSTVNQIMHNPLPQTYSVNSCLGLSCKVQKTGTNLRVLRVEIASSGVTVASATTSVNGAWINLSYP
jgi:hypothetical protein